MAAPSLSGGGGIPKPFLAPSKAEGALRFVEATGRRAAIGSLGEAERIVAGAAGTQVRPRVAV